MRIRVQAPAAEFARSIGVLNFFLITPSLPLSALSEKAEIKENSPTLTPPFGQTMKPKTHL